MKSKQNINRNKTKTGRNIRLIYLIFIRKKLVYTTIVNIKITGS